MTMLGQDFEVRDGVRFDRRLGKFQGEAIHTQLLWVGVVLGGFANEEAGSSTEGAGAAALVTQGDDVDADLKLLDVTAQELGFRMLSSAERQFWRDQAGAILFERTDGFVSGTYFEDAVQLQSEWARVVEELEPSEESNEESDGELSGDGPDDEEPEADDTDDLDADDLDADDLDADDLDADDADESDDTDEPVVPTDPDPF